SAMSACSNKTFVANSYACHVQEFERKIKAWLPKIYLKSPAEREVKTTMFIAELNLLSIMHETDKTGRPDFSSFRNAEFMAGIYEIFRPALMNPSIGVEWYRVERLVNSHISRGPSKKRTLDEDGHTDSPTKKIRISTTAKVEKLRPRRNVFDILLQASQAKKTSQLTGPTMPPAFEREALDITDIINSDCLTFDSGNISEDATNSKEPRNSHHSTTTVTLDKVIKRPSAEARHKSGLASKMKPKPRTDRVLQPSAPSPFCQ
ncbi:hypothetical protein BDN72DRAFT_833542, partial [Pluteus cervinus]